MTDDWILDVLTDLKDFAEGNDLPALAGRLEETRALAAVELAVRMEGGYATVILDPEATGRYRRITRLNKHERDLLDP